MFRIIPDRAEHRDRRYQTRPHRQPPVPQRQPRGRRADRNFYQRPHTGELKIAAALSDAGRVTYNARTGAHDDLVLAMAIALWFSKNMPVTSIQLFPF
jgi:hypothetical protein